MKVQPSSGHIFRARSWVGRNYPSSAIELVSFGAESGRMSRKLGVAEIPFHHQIMFGDIDDIQDHGYRMSRRTFFNLRLKCTTGIMCAGLRAPGWLFVLGIPHRADMPL